MVEHHLAVQRDGACGQALGEAMRPRDVAGPRRGRQTVVGIVCQGHNFVVVLEGQDRDDRTVFAMFATPSTTICLPTSVDPVNATFSMPGCAVMAAPTVCP